MEGANLNEAQMELATLWFARMEGANLMDARMEGAGLIDTRMEGVNLSNARVDKTTGWTGVVLHNAAVPSVDFRETTISKEQIKTTFGDGSTKLPDTIPRPAHWPDAELDLFSFHTQYKKWLTNPDT